MKATFERLSSIQAPVCVTLILNTHKTFPDNQKDSITLRNMIADAGKRLEKEYSAEISKNYTEKLHKISNEIDHNHNDLGLLVFVNDDIAEYLRIPMSVHDRIILDDTFATRPIVRALQKETDYYVLALAKGKARMLLASGESLIEEIKNEDFPVSDATILKATREEASNAQRMTNLTQEFFNRVDKFANKVRKQNPYPVVIYSEETNYSQYLKEADYPNTILGHVLLQNFDAKDTNLIKEIWPKIEELKIETNRARVTELGQALSSGKYFSDLNEIWTAVQEGRGKTIFVEEGYIQAVKNEDGVLTPIAADDISSKGDINDIVDDMIEHNLKYGGDVVFLEKGSLDKFNKLALVTRY